VTVTKQTRSILAAADAAAASVENRQARCLRSSAPIARSTLSCRNSRSKRISVASVSSSIRSRACSVGLHAGVDATADH
jgi:hypothetical protein